MSTAIATKEAIQEIQEKLESADVQAKLDASLPKHVDKQRFLRVFTSSLQKNPDLLKCSRTSLFQSINEAAQLGLETDGVLGHAYLVPFGDTCTLIVGYKGYMRLLWQSDKLLCPTVESVFNGDDFDYQLGDAAFIAHRPDDDIDRVDPKHITHVYVKFDLVGGGIVRNVWGRRKIEAHKEKYAKGWKSASSAWQTAWEQMAKKTVIRATINSGLLPISTDIQQIVAREVYQEHKSSVQTVQTERGVLGLKEKVLGAQPKIESVGPPKVASKDSKLFETAPHANEQ